MQISGTYRFKRSNSSNHRITVSFFFIKPLFKLIIILHHAEYMQNTNNKLYIASNACNNFTRLNNTCSLYTAIYHRNNDRQCKHHTLPFGYFYKYSSRKNL